MGLNKTNILIFVFLFILSSLSATDFSAEYVAVVFKDKGVAFEEQASVTHLLSEKSLQRRNRQGLSLDWHDYPVDSTYVRQITVAGLQVVGQSKWLNSCLVKLSENKSAEIALLGSLASVKEIRYLGGKGKAEGLLSVMPGPDTQVSEALREIYKVMNLDSLHTKGFRGEGMTVAVLDAGFWGADTLPGFRDLFTRGQMQGVKDFTGGEFPLYSGTAHGTRVLSLLHVLNGPDLLGTAPSANIWLMKTEDISYEHPLEEFYFVQALEYSDSIGVDVVNASLGYYSFDDTAYSYSNNQLYTSFSIATQAATLAASRGMILVTSAGNEGDIRWKEITFPADADSILAVGAVNAHGRATRYASYGRTDAPFVRPNVAAPGHKIYTLDERGRFTMAFGSSYAAPLITGAVLCLWEMFPDQPAIQIIRALERSAAAYESPHLQSGYGLPDLMKASRILEHDR